MRTSGRETGGKNEEEIDRGNGQDRQIREQRDRERGERERWRACMRKTR